LRRHREGKRKMHRTAVFHGVPSFSKYLGKFVGIPENDDYAQLDAHSGTTHAQWKKTQLPEAVLKRKTASSKAS